MQKNDRTYAPIVMFVYNRADHFHQTYEALAQCPEARNSTLFIFSDGPKNEAGAEKVNEVRRALREAEQKGDFREIHIVESQENRGLAKSVIAGVSRVIEQYGTVIVVEDDCVVSPYFLRYMNGALATYGEEKKVGAIAGYTPVFPFPESFSGDVFFTRRSCSWGWATWKDRWETVDWSLDYMRRFYADPSLIRRLNSCGADRFLRLYRQTKGNGSSWSVRFGAQLVLNDQYTVYPRYSYVRNIGCDASGVHSRIEDAVAMEVDLAKAIPNPRLEKLKFDEKIQKAMKKHYSAGVFSDMKRILATAGIVAKERIKR